MEQEYEYLMVSVEKKLSTQVYIKYPVGKAPLNWREGVEVRQRLQEDIEDAVNETIIHNDDWSDIDGSLEHTHNGVSIVPKEKATQYTVWNAETKEAE